MKSIKENKKRTLKEVALTFIPVIMMLYANEVREFLDSIQPNLFKVFIFLIFIFFFIFVHKVNLKIKRLSDKVITLKKENDDYEREIKKKETLLQQLEESDAPGSSKFFKENKKKEVKKQYRIDLLFTANIIPNATAELFDIIYTWEFKGQALENIKNASIKGDITNDSYIDTSTWNLSIKRSINNGDLQVLEENENGYNISHEQRKDDIKGWEIFLSNLIKGNTFKVIVEYTIKSTYKVGGDKFHIFSSALDNAFCDKIEMIIKSRKKVFRRADLYNIDSKSVFIESKALEKIGGEYKLTFVPIKTWTDKPAGYFKIETFNN